MSKEFSCQFVDEFFKRDKMRIGDAIKSKLSEPIPLFELSPSEIEKQILLEKEYNRLSNRIGRWLKRLTRLRIKIVNIDEYEELINREYYF